MSKERAGDRIKKTDGQRKILNNRKRVCNKTLNKK